MRSDSSGSEVEKLCFECHDSEHLAREFPNLFAIDAVSGGTDLITVPQ